MLASILGLKDKSDEIPTTLIEPKKPITTFTLSENLAVPAPQKKPPAIIDERVLDIIDFLLDERIVTNIKQKTKNHIGKQNTAEISVGPIESAENIQLASLQAMAKANAIGNTLKNVFSKISIKFDPLLPHGTVKIVIKGKKHDA